MCGPRLWRFFGVIVGIHHEGVSMSRLRSLPTKGLDNQGIFDFLNDLKSDDADWAQGKTFGLSYRVSEDHDNLLARAHQLYQHENVVSPAAFPSTFILEQMLVGMMRDLLQGDKSVGGSVTSGGTESNMLAVKTYRDWARKVRPEIETPEIILPTTAHPSFLKAADYVGVDVRWVDVDANYKVDLSSLKKAINDNTILIIASAPNLFFGTCDPIAQMAALAEERGIGCHVDACLGGMLYPFMKAGDAPVFDFKVPGVTSIVTDLHKYGYALKGLSVLLCRDPQIRRHQFYVTTEHPYGLYSSPTLLGSRSGGALAAAIACLLSLGKSGFESITKMSLQTSEQLKKAITAIPELQVLGQSNVPIVSFTSDSLNMLSIGKRLRDRGWFLDAQKNPDCLRAMVMPVHADCVDDFVKNLKQAIADEQAAPLSQTAAGQPFLYGLPLKGQPSSSALDELLDKIEKFYRGD
jgi:sphinganine-1-phosphate aldolase